jgi:2-amino-4-hydroxy-6-hydroxymethyldihydropteridine diphosphokinase
VAARPRQIFIGLGSNLGDSRRQLLAAWNLLGATPGVSLIRLSSPYRSAPVDMASGNWFTNAVGEIRADLPPLDLLRRLLAIEAAMGRRRYPEKTGYQDRTLDLDLLYYGGLKLATPDIYLPHPRRRERLFVLEPLAEIAGDFIDGETGRLVSALLAELRQNQRALPEERRQRLYAETWPGAEQSFSAGDP